MRLQSGVGGGRVRSQQATSALPTTRRRIYRRGRVGGGSLDSDLQLEEDMERSSSFWRSNVVQAEILSILCRPCARGY